VTGFEPIRFDAAQCARELDAFARLLGERATLGERADVLPFFRAHRHLTAFLGSYYPNIRVADRIAYELDLFGAFTADVVVGDWERRAYCLVEFEDGAPESVFVRRGRATTEWSTRFEHGLSQIVDWYWKLADLRGTASLAQLFGAAEVDATAILVVGRDAGVVGVDRARLDWRRRRVVVDSRHVYCCTFDELERDLRLRLSVFGQVLAAED
jgi:hypothetical protein